MLKCLPVNGKCLLLSIAQINWILLCISASGAQAERVKCTANSV